MAVVFSDKGGFYPDGLYTVSHVIQCLHLVTCMPAISKYVVDRQ